MAGMADEEFGCEMLKVLEGLGMQDLWPLFQANKVGPKEVDGLSSVDYISLGVTTIGDQIRLKNACRNYIRGEDHPSPVVRRFLELSSSRSKKTRKVDVKSTRNLHIGWKHMSPRGIYQQVSASKGGGTQTLQMEKDSSLESLDKIVRDLYFPNGVSSIKDLKLADLYSFLASYNGSLLPATIGEEPFTVERYYHSLKISPVRIYLHTSKKENALIDEDLPPPSPELVQDDTVVSDKHPSTFSRPNNVGPREVPPPKVPVPVPSYEDSQDQALPSPAQPEPTHSPAKPNASDAKNSDDDFMELDTPTILINRRRHVRLQRVQRGTKNTKNTSPTKTATDNEPGTSRTPVNYGTVERNDHLFLMANSDESNDEDLQNALAESLRPKFSFDDRLLNWRNSSVKDDPPFVLIIHRQKILESTKRAIGRKGFDFASPIKVNFSGEDGEDYGGPRREFLTLLMEEINEHIVTNQSLSHSVKKLSEKTYLKAGQMIVWSLLHGGPGFPFLSNMVVGLLAGDDISTVKMSHDQAPFEDQEWLQKDAETFEEPLVDWLFSLGLSPPFNEDHKEELLTMSLKQILYYRIHAELCQFREGLQLFNFLPSFIEYKTGLESLLCKHEVPLSFQDIKQMITASFSEDGSNYRQMEVDTMYAFDVFLQDCIDGELDVNFGQLLSFWTGASSIPPMGFGKKLEINFVQGCDRLPVAHTCEMSLELARGFSTEGLCEKLCKAIQWGGEFHLV